MYGPWYDLVWSVAAIGALVLLGVALRRWWHRTDEPGGSSILWFAVILLIPVVGPLAFLVTERSRTAVTTSPPH